jgi:tRNA1(Val) A37 N6-methylase TrmN6
LPNNLRPREGEIVGSLGCGDWRIYQIADGNKLTVDDFVCAWVAAEEMRKRGYGVHLHLENATIKGCDDDDRCDDGKMFGGRMDNHRKDDQPGDTNQSIFPENNDHRFNHADIGTGCGSVLMMTAWAFLGEIQSIGVEAQSISFDCLRRGLEWNLGRDGTSSKDVVQIRQNDLRTWDGYGVSDLVDTSKVETPSTASPTGDGKNDPSPGLRAPYRLITGTPPYFPLDSFVASQNHEQKVRCRVPTRGGAPNYIEAASRFLMEEKFDQKIEGGGETANGAATHSPIETSSEGVFCMVEAAFDKAEVNVLDAAKKFNMRVRRRVDVVTRVGLPPRFSCWVMTKKNTLKIDEVASTTVCDDGSSISKETFDKEAEKKEEKNSDDDCDSFPIETFTLRNADLTRTKEYTDAMEIMGWVDFEKSKRKTNKSLKEII